MHKWHKLPNEIMSLSREERAFLWAAMIVLAEKKRK
nr:MAG TPA: Protein of unknown function (DUF3775) [Caudoviricetes sp.]DAZ36518.1 MAG TPA: Protein of unknown function (DUF3775) [Caudoviricetes sp.]